MKLNSPRFGQVIKVLGYDQTSRQDILTHIQEKEKDLGISEDDYWNIDHWEFFPIPNSTDCYIATNMTDITNGHQYGLAYLERNASHSLDYS